MWTIKGLRKDIGKLQSRLSIHMHHMDSLALLMPKSFSPASIINGEQSHCLVLRILNSRYWITSQHKVYLQRSDPTHVCVTYSSFLRSQPRWRIGLGVLHLKDGRGTLLSWTVLLLLADWNNSRTVSCRALILFHLKNMKSCTHEKFTSPPHSGSSLCCFTITQSPPW